MGETAAFELISMGMRYWFTALIALILLRAVWLYRAEARAYRHTLRRLPDAGLVGELVDMATDAAYPLPREGMIGSGRSCDIRLPGLKRREIEFVFRPGEGMRLLPLHRRAKATLDGEPLNNINAYALHGTVLEIRETAIRFRLFAGLKLPHRQAPAPLLRPENIPILPEADYQLPLPEAAPPMEGMDLTWNYAPLPPEDMMPPPEPRLTRRERRAQKREGRNG